MKKLVVIICAAISIISCGDGHSHEEVTPTLQKIVSIGGTITETIYALGEGDQIVGVDLTSTYPEETKKITQLGHSSRLAPESILSTGANLLIGLRKDVSKQLEERLVNSGLKCLILDLEYSKKGTEQLIANLAKHFNKKAVGDSLITALNKDFHKVTAYKEEASVLFIYARGAGTLMVAGKNTAVDAMIGMSGGKNAIQSFEGYKALNAEALVAASPDVILLFDSGLRSLGGDLIKHIPGVALTPAGKSGKIISMDSQLLSGFGPRLGTAVYELGEKIHQ